MSIVPSSLTPLLMVLLLVLAVLYYIYNNNYFLISIASILLYITSNFVYVKVYLCRNLDRIKLRPTRSTLDNVLGLEFTIAIEVENNLPIDLLLRLKGVEISHTGLKLSYPEDPILLSRGSRTRLELKGRGIYQGEYLIRSIHLKLTPTPLFSLEFARSLDISIRLYPKTYMILTRIMGFLIGAEVEGEQVTQKASRSGVEYLKSREFTPGDELRRIDWKATARLQRMMVKEYAAHEGGGLLVLLDISDPYLSDLALDRIAHAAVLMINSLVNSGVPIGMGLWTGEDIVLISELTVDPDNVRKMYSCLLRLLLRGFKTYEHDVECIALEHYEHVLRYLKLNDSLRTIYDRAYQEFRQYILELGKRAATVDLRGVVVVISTLTASVEGLLSFLKSLEQLPVTVVVVHRSWEEYEDLTIRRRIEESVARKRRLLDLSGIPTVVVEPERVIERLREQLGLW